MNRPVLRRYIEITLDAAFAVAAYFLFGWIGFAVVALLVIGILLFQLLEHQQNMTNTLLSRLPERCAFCHREIVDEGGIFDEEGIYHQACLDKLYSLESLRKTAGVPASRAIHKPRLRSQVDKS